MSMKIKLLIISALLVVISCKKESNDLLTDRIWVLDKGCPLVKMEGFKLYSNGNYAFDSFILSLEPYAELRCILSGVWKKDGNNIIFVTSKLDLPEDTNAMLFVPPVTETSIGALYLYLIDRVYQNDSSLIDSLGRIKLKDINESGIFKITDSQEWFWEIKRQTNDSLFVELSNKTNKYSRVNY